ALDPSQFRTGDAVNRCQQAIGSATTRFLRDRSKALQRCWDARLRGVHANPCPDPGDGKAAGLIRSAERRKVTHICRACGGTSTACDVAGATSPAAVGFVTACPVVTPFAQAGCGASIAGMGDVLACVDCVTTFETDCADAAAVPALAGPLPQQCNPTT